MSPSPLFRPFAALHPPALRPLSPLDDLPPPCYPDSSSRHFLDFPPSPSDSSLSTHVSPSPPPGTVRVVCDVPLLAPRPLPYHSPTFLQFDLPDTDEDLSHPPYTHRPLKRKRDIDDPPIPQPQSKRRPVSHRISRPTGRPPPPHLSHRSANHRPRT